MFPKPLQRALGLFAYYAKWVPNFSDRVSTLKNVRTFPMGKQAVNDFNELKQAIANATLKAIDDTAPFTVECDASEIAISATLNQGGRPVAFFSRTLHKSELRYPAVEKEAMSIIESVRKWSHLLIRQRFTLITDQKSVAFMLDNRKRTKIKNNKILGWRLDLAPFSYSIQYRPGVANVGPDTLTRAFCASMTSNSLMDTHRGLGCPGVTRLYHFVKQKNLPFSLEEVKQVCKACTTCAELKPKFFSPPMGQLIKATQPMERLNIDFKGPLPAATKNKYFLCVIDEFSRFPFCFPCPDMNTDTIIKCLDSLFSTYGTCGYVHSDRWSAFKSEELKHYFLNKGIATSNSTPYHPTGNSQVERYNGIIWRATRSLLMNKKLDTKYWEIVLPQALHSIRSLLCTSTNQTPHERFFNFARRSSTGTSLPGWLSTPGPIMLRKFVRQNKNDPLVQKVHLIEANPAYARVRFPGGRESTVSLRDLARCPAGNCPLVSIKPNGRVVNVDNQTDDSDCHSSDNSQANDNDCHSSGQHSRNDALQSQSDCYTSTQPVFNPVSHPTHTAEPTQQPHESADSLPETQVRRSGRTTDSLPETQVRRSGRTTKAPKKLDDYVLEGALPD